MLATTSLEALAAPPPTAVPALSERAQGAYQVFRDVALRVSSARGYSRAVTQVFFFCPGEVVADALCMARSTLYRKLEELRAAKLVEARAHYVTHRGRTRADGMVWAVKLHPDMPGPVDVPWDYLKASYRCLSADIEAGRTAWKLTKSDSHKTPLDIVDIQKILVWAVAPSPTENPDMGLTVRPDLETVLDVPHVAREDRAAAVEGAAQALTAGLRDRGGLMFYRWLLWQLLRLQDRTGAAPWYVVYEGARRARADAAEGFARRPGALFVSRLKAGPHWEALRRASGRVGSRPK